MHEQSKDLQKLWNADALDVQIVQFYLGYRELHRGTVYIFHTFFIYPRDPLHVSHAKWRTVMMREEGGGVSLPAREAMRTVLRAGDLRGTTIILRTWVAGRNGAILLPHTVLTEAGGETCPLHRTLRSG